MLGQHNFSDTIFIRDLTVSCILGMLPQERITPQRVIFNVELYTDLSKAMHSDSINDTLNYAEACDIISKVATELKANMVEYLAEHIILALQEAFGASLQGLTLEIHKPDILPNTQSVGIKVTRFFTKQKPTLVFIAIGSNMHRHLSLRYAMRALSKIMNITAKSSVYESVPLHAKGQNFFNAVVSGYTTLSLTDFLQATKEIEQTLGCDSWTNATGQQLNIRCLDLDILTFGDTVSQDTPQLPRQDIYKYDFVAVPMAEIAPLYQAPTLTKNMTQLKQELDQHTLVLRTDCQL